MKKIGMIFCQQNLGKTLWPEEQNLEILKQVYQMLAQASNENAAGVSAGDDENDQRLKRAFKKRFREICGQLYGNKIQAIVQIGTVEA